MFKLAAFVALMFCSYLLMMHYVPTAWLVSGFMVSTTFIAYWWCAFAAYSIVAWRAIF